MKRSALSKRFLLAGLLLAGLLLVGPVCAAPANDGLDTVLEALTGRVLDEQIAQQQSSEDSRPSTAVRAAAELARTALEAASGDAQRQQDYIAALLVCGLRDRARAQLAGYPSDTADPAIAGLRYQLASAYLGNAQIEEAARLLPRKPSSSPALNLRWAELAGRLLLVQQRPREAVEQMSAYLARDPVGLLSLDGDDELLVNILRYNLALALIRSGALDQGRSLLDWLGRRTAERSELVALRDQANLSLGDLLLDEAQGSTAREAYLRVGSEGRTAGRAMLGLGWASIADAGKRHPRLAREGGERALRATPDFVLKALRRRELIGCRTYNHLPHASGELCSASARIASSDAGSDEAQRLRAAIQVWRWLIDREPDSLAAREAALASASALAKLGESSAAISVLQTLAGRLAIDRDRLSAGIGSLDDVRLRLPEQGLAPAGLADALGPQLSMKLFADAAFAQAWNASLDARRLAEMALEPSLAAELAELADRFLEQARRKAVEHLQAEDRLYLQYQQAARQGLSRLLDPS